MKKLSKMLVCTMVVTGVLITTTLNVFAKESVVSQKYSVTTTLNEDDDLYPPAH